jgi:hypothetical protein
MPNIRHDLDPALVFAQIEKKIAYYEKNRIREIAQQTRLLDECQLPRPEGQSSKGESLKSLG